MPPEDDDMFMDDLRKRRETFLVEREISEHSPMSVKQVWSLVSSCR